MTETKFWKTRSTVNVR